MNSFNCILSVNDTKRHGGRVGEEVPGLELTQTVCCFFVASMRQHVKETRSLELVPLYGRRQTGFMPVLPSCLLGSSHQCGLTTYPKVSPTLSTTSRSLTCVVLSYTENQVSFTVAQVLQNHLKRLL